jgi:hypothetical protein
MGMTFRCSQVLAFVHSGIGPHYEFAGVWLVQGGHKLYARNANGHLVAELTANAANRRLRGQLPKGFLDYWVDRFPISCGMLTEPEVVHYPSVEQALKSEIDKVITY